jgi:alpha-beta hydrolase superfamily lysophospholipase
MHTAEHTAPELTHWRLSDGYDCSGRVWMPGADRAQQVIVYLHGIQSHGGWFVESAQRLAENGGAVVLPDRRGSGLNEKQRGHTSSIERWLVDLDEITDWARRRFACERFSIVGVSWGGKLAAAWALRRPERVARLLLIAPGVFPAVDIGLTARLRIGASLTAGGQARFEIPLSDPALFTDNVERQAFIERDQLKLTHATARFLYCSRRLDVQLQRLRAGALQTPATLLLAQADRIIRNDRTRAWAERVFGQKPEIHCLPSAHTLEFCANPADFFSIIETWREAGIGSSW